MPANQTPGFRIPFSGVGYQYGSEEIEIVVNAMQTTSTLTQGERQAQFEDDFSHFLAGSMQCFATSSAAAALELASILIGVRPGDEVIIPAHTYTASAYPFARRGAKIRWADIDARTFVVDPQSIRSLISEKTKAIVLVHLYGLPVDLDPILEIAKTSGILVVEDCAQSLGAQYQNERTGIFGDLSVFSFQSHKNISTLGEGGVLAVADPNYAKHVAGLRHNGHRPYERADDRYWYPAMSDVAFDIEGEWPHNFCLGEVQAALGSFLLGKIDEINSRRRYRFMQATAALAEYPELEFQEIPADRISSHHLLPFRYKSPNSDRSNHDFIRELAYEKGIQCATQYYPLYRYPLYRDSENGEANVPNTDDLFDNMVSLPFHSWMPEIDFAYMIEQVAVTAQKFRSTS